MKNFVISKMPVIKEHIIRQKTHQIRPRILPSLIFPSFHIDIRPYVIPAKRKKPKKIPIQIVQHSYWLEFLNRTKSSHIFIFNMCMAMHAEAFIISVEWETVKVKSRNMFISNWWMWWQSYMNIVSRIFYTFLIKSEWIMYSWNSRNSN